jgi:hypothetical protein
VLMRGLLTGSARESRSPRRPDLPVRGERLRLRSRPIRGSVRHVPRRRRPCSPRPA